MRKNVNIVASNEKEKESSKGILAKRTISTKKSCLPVNTELLFCMACLNPSDSFSAFDKKKLIRFAEFYPSDFSALQLLLLDNQLENYIMDVGEHPDFSDLKSIGNLSQRMIETKKDVVYPLVYHLLKLSLILPVATATVERSFSAMKIIKKYIAEPNGRRADE